MSRWQHGMASARQVGPQGHVQCMICARAWRQVRTKLGSRLAPTFAMIGLIPLRWLLAGDGGVDQVCAQHRRIGRVPLVDGMVLNLLAAAQGRTHRIMHTGSGTNRMPVVHSRWCNWIHSCHGTEQLEHGQQQLNGMMGMGMRDRA
jgi:hypothetical protein